MSVTLLDESWLKKFPLPTIKEGSKDHRGRVAILGGSREMSGAVLLSGIAAMRVGAGKVQVATVESRAGMLAAAFPEALLIGLPETEPGSIDQRCVERLDAQFDACDALLLGPGMLEDADGAAIVARFLRVAKNPKLVLDAGALNGLLASADLVRMRDKPVVLTPHTGELANMLGVTRDEIDADPVAAAAKAAADLKAVIVMKGSRTNIVAPDVSVVRYDGGGVGLATAGSGDVLAGLIAGLLALGSEPFVAASRGVYLHGEAGTVLSASVGQVGFLAREIADVVPRLMSPPR